MAGLINVYAQPSTYQAFQLTAHADMNTALAYLQTIGYTGNISVDANGTWTMFFNSTTQNTNWTAKITDWIVIKNNTTASAVPNSQAAQNYTTTPPA